MCWVALLVLTRFAALETLPAGFHTDEASFWLNAESLRRFGRDEDGRPWPLWITSYIDPKPALYSWMQAPLLHIFGQSVWVTRLPGAVAAVISAAGLVMLFQRWLPRQTWPWVLVWILVSPWLIVVSRGTQEVIWAFACTVWMAVALETVWKEQRRQYQIARWGGVFVLAIMAGYWYHSAKVFVPLILGWTLAFPPAKRHFLRSTTWWTGVAATGLLTTIMAVLLLSGAGGRDRIEAVGVMSDRGPQLIMEEQIRTASGITPIPVLRLWYNKPVQFGLEIFHEYANHFSPDYLVFDLGEPRRYWTPFHGPLLYVQVPLILIGIGVILRARRHDHLGLKLLGWTLLAPIPAALTTQELPSLVRALPLLVPLLALTVLGSNWIWTSDVFSKRSLRLLWRVGFLALLLANTAYFANQYVVQQPRYHPWRRDVADQRTAQWLAEHRSDQPVLMTGRFGPQYPYLLWSGALTWEEYLPVAAQRHEKPWQAGRYVFGSDDCPGKTGQSNVVYVVDVRCEILPGYISLQVIRYADNAEEFDVRVFDPSSTPSALPSRSLTTPQD